ncbi:TPA: restriction endonuclease subunit S, partial [Vibrio vulnificus]|nr:restriction endonuclease subunit S [Vibrio vulnificus]HDY7438733.1 restriction endonuclease subunit S [Vibrio vulnificus]
DSVVGYTPYDKEIPTVYFDYFIKTAKENLERFAPSTAQKNINLEILSNVLVPCPPKQQFPRIVEKVTVLLGICDELKGYLRKSQMSQLQLTDAIIEQAV